MYEFIFLGIIPGTHIQVTFSVWLLAAGIITAAALARRIARHRIWRFPYQHGKFAEPVRR